MKVITTNLLNYFWKNGVKPIKDAVGSKLDASKVANNLTTTVAGYALDARQGRELNNNKLSVTNVANNLATTQAGYALDARQGKALEDKIAALNGKLTWKRTRALYILGLNTEYDCVIPSDSKEVLVVMAVGNATSTTIPDNNRTTLVIPYPVLTGVYTISLYDNASTYLSIKARFANNKITFTQQNTGSTWTGVRLFAEIYYR